MGLFLSILKGESTKVIVIITMVVVEYILHSTTLFVRLTTQIVKTMRNI